MISIIIPYYNSASWISGTLDSCLQQREFIKEIIVVDDFSSDNGWEIITEYQARYPGMIILRKNRKKGGNNARNYGFELAAGEFIQWLDADDQIMPGKFAAQSALFNNIENIDIVYSDWQLETYDEHGKIVLREYKQKGQYEDFLQELLMDNWSPPHNYLLKRSFAEKLSKIDAWNPETVAGQDREYFTLAAILGARFRYAPGCYSIYNRWNRLSVSATKAEVKYRSIEKMLRRFEEMLHQQTWIRQQDVSRYQKIINTHKLMIRAVGIPAPISFGKVNLHNVEWQMVKGIRTTLKVLLETLKAQIARLNVS